MVGGCGPAALHSQQVCGQMPRAQNRRLIARSLCDWSWGKRDSIATTRNNKLFYSTHLPPHLTTAHSCKQCGMELRIQLSERTFMRPQVRCPVPQIKIKMWGWVQGLDRCSSRRPRFNSQHPRGGSQQSGIPALGDLTLTLTSTCSHVTHIHVLRHTHTENKYFSKYLLKLTAILSQDSPCC